LFVRSAAKSRLISGTVSDLFWRKATKDMATLTKRLDTHFAACAAAAAGAALVGTAENAQAAIVHSGAVNVNIPSSFAGIYLNVVTGATGGASFAGFDINPYGATYLRLFVGTGGGHANVAGNFNLPVGTPVGPASTFTAGVSNPPAANWNLNSTNNIAGFRFTNEAMGNQIQYGWYRMSISASTFSQPRAIVEWAYDNTGGQILAGVVPAPGALALLALGAVSGRRRRVA